MAAAQGEVVKSSFSSFEGFMSFVQLLLSRVVWWLWRSSSVPTSVVAFVAPLGFCLLGCWALVVVGGVMVFVGEVVLLGGRRWRAVPDAGKTMAGLVLAGLVVTSGGFPTESPTALQMGLLAVGMMVVEAVMSGSLRAVLVADGLARAGCAAGFTLLVVTAVRTGQVAWAVPHGGSRGGPSPDLSSCSADAGAGAFHRGTPPEVAPFDGGGTDDGRRTRRVRG